MKVFVTGASGHVGSAVVQELIRAGHEVVGLARSENNENALKKMGARILFGSLEDLESLRRGAADSDGVVHCAFSHDFSKIQANAQDEKRAIEALGSGLAGSNRPLVVTSGVALISPGRLVAEDSVRSPDNPFPRDPEAAAFAFADRGVRASAVRLPPVTHDKGHGGFMNMLTQIAREKGVSAYVGDGLNVWPAVHRIDAADLFRRALEQGVSGTRYHAVAEEGIAFKDIATALGHALNVPIVSKTTAEAAEHFGWFAHFSMLDAPASSKKTRELLGWRPNQVGLIDDINNTHKASGR